MSDTFDLAAHIAAGEAAARLPIGWRSSESVMEGHPDKVADFIADRLLDSYLAQDPGARVAIEVLVKGSRVVVAGEVTADASVDIDAIVRDAVRAIGYTDPLLGFCAGTLEVLPFVTRQGIEIDRGVRGLTDPDGDMGAGDQGFVVGYALLRRALGDRYFRRLPPTVNPAGTFIEGGPAVDCGVTGRKTAVDTYGGWARHGGGAFSGKDPSKLDRSGAYFCRWVARQVVDLGLARHVEIQATYVIGRAKPDAIAIETFGTGDDRAVESFVNGFDFRPGAILERLRLRRPIYAATTNYGHFGRPGLPWEE